MKARLALMIAIAFSLSACGNPLQDLPPDTTMQSTTMQTNA